MDMKIYDISQEVFGCEVFSGDPAPQRVSVSSLDRGDVCNLTQFSMCAHNGTHIDAPYHFLANGDTVERISLDKTVGMAYVAEHRGILTAQDADSILQKANEADPESARRILIKGKATVSYEAAEMFAEAGVVLVGNESQTVGPEDAPMAVHRLLLGVGTVLLEGIRLSAVDEGVYFLNAAPLCLGGSDGAPCRALLIK
jgi:arylformamidase